MQDHVQSALRVIRHGRKNQGGNSGSRGTAVSVGAITNHQGFRGADAELLQRNLKQARIRFLYAVLEGKRIAIDELAEPVVLEHWREMKVNVADNSDAHAATFQILQNTGHVWVRHGYTELSVTVVAGQGEFGIETGKAQLEQNRGPMKVR